MKSTLQKVYSKLPKVELEKVELGLVDDAKKVISKYPDIDEDKAFSLVVKAEMQYKDVLNEK